MNHCRQAEWSSSGTVLGSETLVLTPATVQPNAIVECAVTVQDGFGASSTENAMVTVGNSAPTISDITITPDPANNDSTLTCAIVTSDADGGTPTESFAWSNASTGVSLGSGATLTLSSALASRTDEIQCTGTSTDSTGEQATATASLILTNRVPVAPTVSVSPDPASNIDPIVCTSVGAQDPDGDTITKALAGALMAPLSRKPAIPSLTQRPQAMSSPALSPSQMVCSLQRSQHRSQSQLFASC